MRKMNRPLDLGEILLLLVCRFWVLFGIIIMKNFRLSRAHERMSGMRKYLSDNEYDYPPFREQTDYRPFRRRPKEKPAAAKPKTALKSIETAFDDWLDEMLAAEAEEMPNHPNE